MSQQCNRACTNCCFVKVERDLIIHMGTQEGAHAQVVIESPLTNSAPPPPPPPQTPVTSPPRLDFHRFIRHFGYYFGLLLSSSLQIGAKEAEKWMRIQAFVFVSFSALFSGVQIVLLFFPFIPYDKLWPRVRYWCDKALAALPILAEGFAFIMILFILFRDTYLVNPTPILKFLHELNLYQFPNSTLPPCLNVTTVEPNYPLTDLDY